ncbi:hypothetical protein BD410DRAFT_876801 [Rickenella mellea]|uniref:F-box domain-containing protein n=1 Tax=Rickenella mellea TaxID=50990 RepID=A0A4Y7PVT2_9AGAM|nr:hypothetical protein BD410DRAFT_876801 [Rickenella mellea]
MASRVKYLTVKYMYGHWFKERDLGKVATTRQTFHILPNLIQLTLTTINEDEFWFSVIFLHPMLQRLVLEIPKNVPPKRFFLEISHRSSKLCHLDLRMPIHVRSVEAELTAMLTTLTNLKTVIVPCYCLSSSIIACLSRLPNLGTIQSQSYSNREIERPADVRPFCPVVLEGAFPSLRNLSCDAILRDISSFFAATFAPVNITSLHIKTASIATDMALSVFKCLTDLCHTCIRLKHLSLDLTMDRTGEARGLDENSMPISFKDICPIIDFPHLVSFELTHYLPLDITDDDIDRLARNWPSLNP